MDKAKISFKKALKADKDLIKGWFKNAHVKKYWENIQEREDDFEAYLKGQKSRFAYWICLCDKEPFGLILAADATLPELGKTHTPDHVAPWLEPEGITLLIDFIICEKSYLKKGLSSETLKKFAENQGSFVTAFLSDPEVKNEHAVHVYDQAGFVKVGTFIRGEGFFRGKPHYLMKLKIAH